MHSTSVNSLDAASARFTPSSLALFARGALGLVAAALLTRQPANLVLRVVTRTTGAALAAAAVRPALLQNLSTELHASARAVINRSATDLIQLLAHPDTLPLPLGRLRTVDVNTAGAWRLYVELRPHTVIDWEMRLQLIEDTRVVWQRDTGLLPYTLTAHVASMRVGSGTEVALDCQYRVPGGALGDLVLRALGMHPALLMGDVLRQLKQMLETGQITTAATQPAAAPKAPAALAAPQPPTPDSDPVSAAAAESFPASDAPAWTAGTTTEAA